MKWLGQAADRSRNHGILRHPCKMARDKRPKSQSAKGRTFLDRPARRTRARARLPRSGLGGGRMPAKARRDLRRAVADALEGAAHDVELLRGVKPASGPVANDREEVGMDLGEAGVHGETPTHD